MLGVNYLNFCRSGRDPAAARRGFSGARYRVRVSLAPEQPAAQMPQPPGSVGRALITEAELQARVEEIGAEITADYEGRPPLLVGVLKGAFVFMSDLARAIDLPVEIDFMAVSSYGLSTESSGVVRIIKDLETDVRDRHVVLVEDIVDSGLTTDYLAQLVQARRPASFEICALLVREDARSEGIRYVGFSVPADWLVGYGLDVGERYRELPSVHLFDLDDA